LIERYAVIGGTPQYQVWAGKGSLERVIREAILSKGAPLYEEPLTLVREEQGIRDPRSYFGVLAAIASGRTRNSQIASLLELPSSNVAATLDRLADLGYVREQTPVTPTNRGGRGFWQLSDPFLRFWFRRVAPNRTRRSAVEQRRDRGTHRGCTTRPVRAPRLHAVATELRRSGRRAACDCR
jgi:uncharacterized protein